MINFSGNRMDVVRCVAELVVRSGRDSLSITITTRGSSEDCYVSIVTGTSSEDTVKKLVQNYLEMHTNTSLVITQGG